jgi:CheY-like chemotaxis protein
VAASSAPEAIAILEKRTDMHVVFADLAKPHGITEIELACLVRSQYSGSQVGPGVGLPSLGAEAENDATHKFNYLYRPYRLADLSRALRA